MRKNGCPTGARWQSIARGRAVISTPTTLMATYSAVVRIVSQKKLSPENRARR